LHLVKPLGFSLRNKQLRRAGLDYRGLARLRQYQDWGVWRAWFRGRRLFALTPRSARRYDAPGLID
jgi:tRNA (cytidine/uridine-2'-O-)-methyltransferase